MNNISRVYKLNNGVDIPRIGLGVWKINNEKVSQAISWAIDSGYRHVDTARVYENEQGVGKGILNSGLDRKQVFVTTKLAINDFFRSEKAFYESLSKLQTDYVDLYLLHWPLVNWKGAWNVLENLYEEGKIRAIGVSNFNIKDLEHLKKECRIKPAVNQVELSPFLVRSKLIDYCQSEDIAVEAYSPLTRGKRLNDKTLEFLAREYKKTTAQIMIRWGLQRGLIMLPKSETKSHIESNIDVFDFEIEKSDMKLIDSLNENYTALVPFWGRID